jgi:hypothetical protein
VDITRSGSKPSAKGPAEYLAGAIQERRDGKTVEWLEQVTGE